MKDSKKNVMLQELSKEEAITTYGGAKKVYIAMVVAEGGKIAMVVANK